MWLWPCAVAVSERAHGEHSRDARMPADRARRRRGRPPRARVRWPPPKGEQWRMQPSAESRPAARARGAACAAWWRAPRDAEHAAAAGARVGRPARARGAREGTQQLGNCLGRVRRRPLVSSTVAGATSRNVCTHAREFAPTSGGAAQRAAATPTSTLQTGTLGCSACLARRLRTRQRVWRARARRARREARTLAARSGRGDCCTGSHPLADVVVLGVSTAHRGAQLPPRTVVCGCCAAAAAASALRRLLPAAAARRRLWRLQRLQRAAACGANVCLPAHAPEGSELAAGVEAPPR